MGWSISWLATKDRDRVGVLRSFGLHAVDEPKEYPKGLMSGTSLPNGYYVLFLDKCFHSFVTPEVLSRASHGCEIVGCQVEEHIMASAAFCWRDGVRLWNVVHEAEKGVRNLQVEGTPPGSLTGLAAAAKSQQDKERKVPFLPLPWEVDHYFRVPIDLAGSIVGYEHDRSKYSWGSPMYESLAEGVVS
jgi:hypothetical protein